MQSILVVDDDADICRNMTDIFGDLGYDVDSAEAGDTALEKARARTYDLGLLDLRMPGMDGLTLSRHLRQLQPRIDLVIITAYGDQNLRDEAHEAGVRNVLFKPLDLPSLLTVVKQSSPFAS
jgi:CheY-like chemotaxis protein